MRRLQAKIERLGLEACSGAPGAWLVTAIPAQKNPDVHLVGLRLQPIEKAFHSIPLALFPSLLRVPTIAVDDPVLI